MATIAIDLTAFSAEQMLDLLADIKQEMKDRREAEARAAAQERRVAAAASLREWHAQISAELAEVKAEKNAELVAAGKQRINAIHIAYFLSWHCRHHWDSSRVAVFSMWFNEHQHLFRPRKVVPPKVKPEDLPVAERLRRLAFAAAHINKRVVDFTEMVTARTAALAAVTKAKEQLLIIEHTPQDVQIADYDIETAQYQLNKVIDLLARSKETQRKFAEQHC
jgi:hypothetical protein